MLLNGYGLDHPETEVALYFERLKDIEARARQCARVEAEVPRGPHWWQPVTAWLSRLLRSFVRYTPQCPRCEATTAAHAEVIVLPCVWGEPAWCYRCTLCRYVWEDPYMIAGR